MDTTSSSAVPSASFGNPRRLRICGQSMVEFMLVIPVVLLILWGTMELGYMFLVFAEATSASREASRHGASVGLAEGGGPRYLDCAGMRDAARRMLVMPGASDSDIDIAWDHGSTASTIATCDSPPAPADIQLGDRVVVTVRVQYTPLVPVLPIPVMPITSQAARTIMKEIAAGPTATLGGPMATNTIAPPPSPTPTATLDVTLTPTNTPGGPTETPTATETATVELPPTATDTPIPTPTPIPAPGNFNLTVNCSSGKVSFSWEGVPDVHYYAVYEVKDPPPDTQVCLTNKTRCDYSSIPVDGATHTYYVVAVIYYEQGEQSVAMSVSCSP